jgi:hypothetical protein
MVIGHVIRDLGNRRIDHAGIDAGQRHRIFAARLDVLAQSGVAQIGEIDLVELQVAAAGIGEGAHRLAIGLAEIGVKLVHHRIDGLRHGIAAVAEMQRRRRRNGHLRRLPGVIHQELKIVDHRMRLVAAELADDAQKDRAGLRALRAEFDFALARRRRAARGNRSSRTRGEIRRRRST